MKEILINANWSEIILTLWTAILLPIITYVTNEIKKWAKSKKIDKYTDILEKNVVNAVKGIQEAVVKDIKNTEEWTPEKQAEIREVAKTKAIQSLSNAAYECLHMAYNDFDSHVDSLIDTALYDIKNGLK